jgi:hypothetical protein
VKEDLEGGVAEVNEELESAIKTPRLLLGNDTSTFIIRSLLPSYKLNLAHPHHPAYSPKPISRFPTEERLTRKNIIKAKLQAL